MSRHTSLLTKNRLESHAVLSGIRSDEAGSPDGPAEHAVAYGSRVLRGPSVFPDGRGKKVRGKEPQRWCFLVNKQVTLPITLEHK
jgi:hypothetical protein